MARLAALAMTRWGWLALRILSIGLVGIDPHRLVDRGGIGGWYKRGRRK